MRPYKEVPVSAAVRLANEFDKDVVVIVSVDRDYALNHFTSYGRNAADKSDAATLADHIAKSLNVDPATIIGFSDFRDDGAAARNAQSADSAARLLRSLLQRGCVSQPDAVNEVSAWLDALPIYGSESR